MSFKYWVIKRLLHFSRAIVHLSAWTVYKPKWQISLPFHISEISPKKAPLSGGASPYRPLKGVPSPGIKVWMADKHFLFKGTKILSKPVMLVDLLTDWRTDSGWSFDFIRLPIDGFVTLKRSGGTLTRAMSFEHAIWSWVADTTRLNFPLFLGQQSLISWGPLRYSLWWCVAFT